MITYSIKDDATIIFVYLARLIIFLNCSSMLIFWVLIEVNMVLFTSMLFSAREKAQVRRTSGGFKYLVVQTVGRLIIFVRFITSSSYNRVVLETIIMLSLIVKMGVSPFHGWVYNLSKLISPLMLSLLLTFQKIPPLIAMNSLILRRATTVIVIAAIFGSLIIINRVSMKGILVASSIYFTFWVWTILQCRMHYFILTYLIYFSFNLAILNKLGEVGVKGNFFPIEIFVYTSFLVGFPPARMFFFKISSFQYLTHYAQTILGTWIWLAIFLSTLGYLKIIIPTINSVRTIEVKRSIGVRIYYLILIQIILALYITL